MNERDVQDFTYDVVGVLNENSDLKAKVAELEADNKQLKQDKKDLEHDLEKLEAMG